MLLLSEYSLNNSMAIFLSADKGVMRDARVSKKSRMDTRSRIIQAAFSVAAKNGFAGATTKEIARAAECSEGIIYHYFNDKHSLCLEMVREYADEFRGKVTEHLNKFEGARNKIEAVISFQVDYFTREGNIFQVLLGKSGDGTVSMGQILKIAIIPYIRIIESIISEGIAAKELAPVKPSIAASALMGMLQLNILKMHFGFKDVSNLEIKEAVARMFFEGMAV